MMGLGHKWSEETTIKFVKLYVSHECLWNIQHPQYKNKSARMLAYRNVMTNMNLPNFGEKEMVIKIKSIRSTYSGELRKIKESLNAGAGTNNVYVPNLKWFTILHSAILSMGNLEDQIHTADGSDWDTSLRDDKCGVEPCSQYKVKVSLDSIEKPASAQPHTLKKRRIQELRSLLTKVKDVNNIINSPPPEEHEFDVFSRGIAAQLKAMPLEKALQAQQFIQNYITELRLQRLPSSPSTPSPTSQSNCIVKLEQINP